VENPLNENHFDAIVVGSGPSGATLAKELSLRNKKVLILERGGDEPLQENVRSLLSILGSVPVGDKLVAPRAFTSGGTTALYFAVAEFPPLEPFLALGIDLSQALEEAKRELPLATVPDELLGSQSLRIRDSALALGFPWRKNTMLIDFSKCPGGYAYEAKWNARIHVRQAIDAGALLVTRARVTKALVENNEAVGVEYKVRQKKKESAARQVFGKKVIFAGGGAASPILLRNSGMTNMGSSGFYCHPNFGLFGLIPGLKAGPSFVASTGMDAGDGIGVGDGNPTRALYRMFMLGHRRWVRAFLYSQSVGVGVMVKEGMGGGLQENNRYHKELEKEDLARLDQGEEMARRILQHAGARHIHKTALGAAHVGGAVKIGEHVDENLETEYRNLHVCDGSVIPESVKVSPTMTLISLGKYLANRLAPVL
jgi:choline dehydrogenase-like flavoprotein